MKKILLIALIVFVYGCTDKSHKLSKSDKFMGLSGEIEYIIDTLYNIEEDESDISGIYKYFFTESGDVHLHVSYGYNTERLRRSTEYKNGKPCLIKEYSDSYKGEGIYMSETKTEKLISETDLEEIWSCVISAEDSCTKKINISSNKPEDEITSTTNRSKKFDSKGRLKEITFNDKVHLYKYEQTDDKGNWRRYIASIDGKNDHIMTRHIKYKDINNINNELDNEQKYEIAKTKSKSYAETETKCFLDFNFNMSEDDVMSHFEKLRADKVISLDLGRSYVYNFTMDDGMSIMVNFRSEFYNDKLYKMTYMLYNSRIKEDLSLHMYHAFINSDEQKKMNSFTVKNIGMDTIYAYLKDNLIVTFKENEMIYENAPISQKKKEDEAINNVKETKLNKKKSEESVSFF